MFVPTFLLQVYIGLIADKQPMTTILESCCTRVHLIAITQVNSVECSTNHGCH